MVQLAYAMSSVYDGENTLEYSEAILRIGLRRGDEALVTRGLRGMAYYYVNSGMRPIARLLYDECLAHDGASPFLRSVNLANLSSFWASDDLSVAVEYGAEAVRLCDAHGLMSLLDLVLTNLATALLLQGDWDGALALTERRDDLEDPLLAQALDLVAAVVHVARDEPLPAPRWSEAAPQTAAPWDVAYSLAADVVRSVVESREISVDAALRALADYLEIAPLSDDHAVIWPALFDAARAAQDRESVDALIEMTGEATDRSVPIAFRAHRSRALGLLALDDGDHAEAVDHLRHAADRYQQWKAVPLAARTRGELGVALTRSRDEDDVAEGRRLVQEARRLLTELRAEGWLAELATAHEGLETTRG